jgi:hypothetical protein
VFHPSTQNGVWQSEPRSPGLAAVPSQQE